MNIHKTLTEWTVRPKRAVQLEDALVLPLTTGRPVARELVGGKGASLARIAAAGLRVPGAFAVTTSAFRQFCVANRLSAPNGSDIERGQLPADLATSLAEHLALSSGDRFAVRSSASVEDGVQFSMAGQLDTFLNVPRADVADAVKRCWASLFAERAQSYLTRMTTADRDMAVVVQEQIDAKWSGVAFSLDPLTHSCDDLVVEWTHGLGDKLVSGEIDPERLTLSRLHPTFDSALPDGLAVHLTNLHGQLLTLEKALECPVDVEWCATNDDLWILQVRPITTVQSEDHLLWSNVNLTENFPNPLAPLAWSIIERFYEEYMLATLRLFGWKEAEFARVQHLLKSITGTHGGRIYYNLSSWYRLISYFPRGRDLQRCLNTYIGQGIPIGVSADQRAPELRTAQQSVWGTVRLASYLMSAFVRTEARVERLETALGTRRKAWRKRLAEAVDPRVTLELVDEIMGCVAEEWQGPCGADLMVMIVPSLLGQLLDAWTNQNASTELLPQLLQGVSVKSDEPSRLLWQLSQRLKAAGRDITSVRGKEQLTAEDHALFQEFIERFGARCYNDCSLITPTFEEQPELAWNLVAQFENVPDRFSDAAKAPLMAARERTLAQTCSGLSAWKAALVRKLVALSLKAIQNREAGRMQQSILFAELRQALRRTGALLEQRATLETADDIFFCTLNEVDALSRNAFVDLVNLPEVILRRKQSHVALRDQFPPSMFMLRAGAALQPSVAPRAPLAANGGSAILRGVPVSRGKVSGVARVVRDPSSGETLERGQILVASSTDPGWTPLFMLASGLILERGGLLSHGAIVAREMDIPALVGVKDACARIPNGSSLLLDANNGLVDLAGA
jgi:pyruvate,water dikinase